MSEPTAISPKLTRISPDLCRVRGRAPERKNQRIDGRSTDCRQDIRRNRPDIRVPENGGEGPAAGAPILTRTPDSHLTEFILT